MSPYLAARLSKVLVNERARVRPGRTRPSGAASFPALVALALTLAMLLFASFASARPLAPPPGAAARTAVASHAPWMAPPEAHGHYDAMDASQVSWLAPPEAHGHYAAMDTSQVSWMAPPEAHGHYTPVVRDVTPPAAAPDPSASHALPPPT